MAKYQLWSRDEYGQGTIHASGDSIEKLFEEGKKLLQEENVNNALTEDGKKVNWEAYMVFIGDKENRYYYAGKPINKHMVIDVQEDTLIKLEQIIDKYDVKIYCGQINQKDWFAEDYKGNRITINSSELENKTCYFIMLL